MAATDDPPPSSRPPFTETMQIGMVVREAAPGRELPLRGTFGGIDLACLGTARALGALIEVAGLPEHQGS